MSLASSRTLNPRGDFADLDDYDDRRRLAGHELQLAWITFGVLIAALTSAYFNMLEFTSTYWVKDMYSHGWIVPLFAGYLFWMRSRSDVKLSNQELTIGGGIIAACVALNWYNASSGGQLANYIPGFKYWFPHLQVWLGAAMFVYCLKDAALYETPAVERWIGVAVIAACLGIRVFASYYDYNNYERASFIVALLGVCLFVGGLKMIRWAWPPIVFLILMFPLPYFLENTLLMNLQKVATIMSTWTLQLLGVSAARAGNQITIDTLVEPLQVAEACSGLRMLTIFGAFTFAMIMIIDRPWWDKLAILVLGWIPIALISNVIRIVTTALLFMAFGQDNKWLDEKIHDYAGYAMMPVGLGLLWVGMTVLSRITIPTDSEDFGDFRTAPA